MCSTLPWVGFVIDFDCVFWLGLIEVGVVGGWWKFQFPICSIIFYLGREATNIYHFVRPHVRTIWQLARWASIAPWSTCFQLSSNIYSGGLMCFFIILNHTHLIDSWMLALVEMMKPEKTLSTEMWTSHFFISSFPIFWSRRTTSSLGSLCSLILHVGLHFFPPS